MPRTLLSTAVLAMLGLSLLVATAHAANATTPAKPTGPVVDLGKEPTEEMVPGLILPGTKGGGITLSSDGTGFRMTGGVGGLSAMTARIRTIRELSPAGAVVQEAAIAYGQYQDISEVPPWDKSIVQYDEWQQSIGLAAPDTSKFTWNFKQFAMQQPLETVSGSKVFILLQEGNVDGAINIQWPVKNYSNHFQVCSFVQWNISSIDWPSFINNVTLPGQNVSKTPPITRTMRKSNQNQVMGFTLDGSFSFAYLWPGPVGYVFLAKNPWTMSGHPYYGPQNVTFTDASWTQNGHVTVCVNADRTAETIKLEMLIDADTGAGAGVVPNFAWRFVLDMLRWLV